jgi:GNAT superfamily N-acetyltransferase
MPALRRLSPEDVPRLRRFWLEHWGGEEILANSHAFRADDVEGLVNADWTALVTFVVGPDGCEIVSLNSLVQGMGTGTALIDAVAEEAAHRGCRRVFLSTTNDNLDALGFYQRRGFQLAGLLLGAVNESRREKPGIPQIEHRGIPIRDEIILELPLAAPSGAVLRH